mmetsp:Transcript_15735/g.26540  ORF Transcript_15735/g.26540 Transcript_15735/m.26540 type:complete len:223 (-) Transcript_15735:99-767(-)
MGLLGPVPISRDEAVTKLSGAARCAAHVRGSSSYIRGLCSLQLFAPPALHAPPADRVFLRLALVLVQKHVRNAFRDGEAATGLRADQRALLHVQLKQSMVELLQKFLVLHDFGGDLGWQPTNIQAHRGIDERLPLQFGNHALQKLGVEIGLLDLYTFRLDFERESTLHSLYVARKHVVCNEPHRVRLCVEWVCDKKALLLPQALGEGCKRQKSTSRSLCRYR